MQEKITDKQPASSIDARIVCAVVVYHAVAYIYPYGVFSGLFADIGTHAAVSHEGGFVPGLGQAGPGHVLPGHETFPVCLAVTAGCQVPDCDCEQ